MKVRRRLIQKESIFRSLVRQLREAEEPQEEPGEDSIDAQIDKYFSEYESEAKNAKNEGLDFRQLTRRFLIEAGEDEEDEKGEEKDEEDEEGSDEEDKEEGGEGEEESEEATPEKLKLEDIDMKSFVTDVMRLVDNYDNLLEIRNTILRRASNFLSKSYEKDATDVFKEELLESFGIEIGQTEAEKQDKFIAPKAGAAGPLGGGGA